MGDSLSSLGSRKSLGHLLYVIAGETDPNGLSQSLFVPLFQFVLHFVSLRITAEISLLFPNQIWREREGGRGKSCRFACLGAFFWQKTERFPDLGEVYLRRFKSFLDRRSGAICRKWGMKIARKIFSLTPSESGRLGRLFFLLTYAALNGEN